MDRDVKMHKALVGNETLDLTPQNLRDALEHRYEGMATQHWNGNMEYSRCIEVALAMTEIYGVFELGEFPWNSLDRSAQTRALREGEANAS